MLSALFLKPLLNTQFNISVLVSTLKGEEGIF